MDQNIVLDVQQRSALQLTDYLAAIPEIFVQPRRQQRQCVAVSEPRRRAKPLVNRTANNAVMVYQRERFVRSDFLELIFGRGGTRDVRRPCLW
jgi:hypothetical protein